MDRCKIIEILCKLTSDYYDYENEQNAFTFDLDKRRFEITFERRKGKFKSFTVKDAGEVACESTSN